MFTHSLICVNLRKNNTMNIEIRELKRNDYSRGIFETLESLTDVGEILKEEWNAFIDYLNSNPNHCIWVAVVDEKIVGTITCLIEPKIIHKCSFVAHIEDVAVHKDYQGKKIANKLITQVLEYAKEKKAYKVILNCTNDLIGWYSRFGFQLKDVQMRKNI